MTFPLSDRVLRDDYLMGLDERSLADIRAMRSECEGVEVAISFARRVLQGHLDIVDSELGRRDHGGSIDVSSLHELVERLPQILTDDIERSSSPSGRPLDLDPELPTAELLEAIDRVVDGGALNGLDQAERAEVERIAGRLRVLEKEFSQMRRSLHERIDLLKRELTGRYERGEVTIEGLLG